MGRVRGVGDRCPEGCGRDCAGPRPASDAHLTVEVFAGLLTDSLTAPTLAADTSAELAIGVEL